MHESLEVVFGTQGHVFRGRDRTGSVHVATRHGLQTGGMISEKAGGGGVEEGEVFPSMQTHLLQPCRCVRTNHVMWVNGASCCNPTRRTASSRHNLDSHVQPPSAKKLNDRQIPPLQPPVRDHENRSSRQCAAASPCASEVAVARPAGRDIFHSVVAVLDPEDHRPTQAKICDDLTLISSNKLNHFP